MENNVDSALQTAEQIANEARTLSQRVAAYSKRLTSDGDSLAEEVTGLSKKVEKSLRDATKHLDEGDKWVDVIKELELARCIIYGSGAGGDLRKLTRNPKPAILGMLLGRSTNVVTVRKDQSLQLKEEYHRFRNRAAYTMCAIAACLKFCLWRANTREGGAEGFSFSPVVTVGVQLFLCWLLYFYTAAALRESVLRMNGSHIRPWWIHHHYWSIATALVMLSLPVDSASYRRATEFFLGWAMLQAVVILMQNKYQRRRMYTRIAMGKNSPHDVVCGESSGGHGQLVLLYPMLFILQAFQLYIGADMVLGTYWAFLTPEGYVDFERKETDLWGSRGVFLAGCNMIYMALMNFKYTVVTIMGKSAAREKALVRSSLMKARQQGNGAPPASTPTK